MNIFIILKEQEGYGTYIVYATFDETKADTEWARLVEENTDRWVHYTLNKTEVAQ